MRPTERLDVEADTVAEKKCNDGDFEGVRFAIQYGLAVLETIKSAGCVGAGDSTFTTLKMSQEHSRNVKACLSRKKAELKRRSSNGQKIQQNGQKC